MARHENAETMMQLRTLALALGLLAAAPANAAGSPFTDAADLLDGRWQDSEGFVLRIDQERAQASVDPARPFKWQRFLVKAVEGNTIVFAIGSDVFEAALEGGNITLTGTGFRGERILRRGTAFDLRP